MEYSFVAKSELKISKIGFGCMALKSFADGDLLIHKAIDSGMNFFDTADLYEQGKNEEILGKALSYKRNDVIVATKVGNQMRPDGSGWDWNPRKEYILKSVEGSLKRLRTDYIDLYQLHGGTIEDQIDETIEAFELLKQQGKIRHYGISSIRPNVIKEYVRRSGIVSVMMQYSLLDRRPEESCLKLLEKNGIAVLARGVLAQGLLVDKPAKAYLEKSEEEVSRVVKAIADTAAGRSMDELAIAYVLANKAIASAVVGIRTEAQLNSAIKAIVGKPLEQTDVVNLQNRSLPNIYRVHR